MYSRTPSMSGTTLYWLLTGRPQPRSRSYQPDWVSGAPSRCPSSPGPAAAPVMPVSSAEPSTRPMPCTIASSARDAVIRGSFCRSDPAAELGRPVGPAAQVLVGEHVVQAEQPLQVLDRGEQRGYRPVHGLGRRVGRAQLRVLILERAQLAHLGVVVDVGDRGRIQDVIPVIGLGDLQAEVRVPPSGLRRSLLDVPARLVLAHLGSSPVSSISSASMLPASRQRV